MKIKCPLCACKYNGSENYIFNKSKERIDDGSHKSWGYCNYDGTLKLIIAEDCDYLDCKMFK